MQAIPGYDGYFVTEDGEVWSNKRGQPKKLANRFNIDGYLTVSLFINGKSYSIGVHRLVALAYISNPNNHPCVCHKDDNPSNPRKDNLFWGTIDMNNKDRASKGRTKIMPGEDNGHARLTDNLVRYIRSFPYRKGLFTDLSKELGFGKGHIATVWRKEVWKHIV